MYERVYGTSVIGDYGRRMRDSRGRFMGNNQSEDKVKMIIDDIYQAYERYTKGRKEYAPKEMNMENLNDMLNIFVDFIIALREDAAGADEVDLIKRYIVTLNEV